MAEEIITTKGELTRREIIKSANDLFVSQGYHGTSMRQIAKNAGIALGGIYNHFESKEEVFQQVFLEHHPYHDVLPALETAKGETVEEFVHDAVQQMLAAVKKRPYFLNLMFIEIVEFKSAHTLELFSDLFPRSLQIAQRIAQQEERLRPIPLPMLVRTFLGLFFSYYLTEIIIGQFAPLEFREDAIDYFVDIFLHGVLDPEKDLLIR